jgi:hypothetical protein
VEIALLVALVFVLGVFVVGTVVTVRSAIRLFRDVGSFLRTVAGSMEALERRLARIDDSTARATERPADLQDALERLARSRTRLRVLTSAVARVRAEASGVTGFYPRK